MSKQYQTDFVNKYGIAEICDVKPSVFLSDGIDISESDYRNIGTGDLVYVTTSALAAWFECIYPRLRNNKIKIFLVTGDSVVSSPLGLFATGGLALDNLFAEGVIQHWFTQNCDLPDHPRVTPIPLGIDFHSRHVKPDFVEEKKSPSAQNTDLLLLADGQHGYDVWQSKRPELFVDIQHSLGTNPSDRMESLEAARTLNSSFMCPSRMKRWDYWELMRQFRFVLSPLGKGIDCHRTWEALALGAVPIVKRSSISQMFDGLPVWFVDSYSEITDTKLAEYGTKSECSRAAMYKLTLEFWQNVIELTRQEYSAHF